MFLKREGFGKRLKSVRSRVASFLLDTYRGCVSGVKSIVAQSSEADLERRKSHAKLQPLPDKPIRRATLVRRNRTSSNELQRLRKKGEEWTAYDLFRFSTSDPEEGTAEDRRKLCYEWLDRLQAISKKFCYLAWYEAAIYACFYRLAIVVHDEEKKNVWMQAKEEYAEIFLMGRRLWRRASHPSRLRVFYDFATLCIRFGITEDRTAVLFRDALSDANNFNNPLLNETEFAQSVDKVLRLENHLIEQFFSRRRRSSGSLRGSFRRKLKHTPSTDEQPQAESSKQQQQTTTLLEPDTSVVALSTGPAASCSSANSLRPQRNNSFRTSSPKLNVRFES